MNKEIIVSIILIITIVIPLIITIIYGILDNIKFHKDMRRKIEEHEEIMIKLKHEIDNRYKFIVRYLEHIEIGSDKK